MVQSQYDTSTNTQNIALAERFDFSIQKEFRDAYRHTEKPHVEFKVDLPDTRYIDSAALGMLLVLDDHAQQLGGKVILCKPSDDALKILQFANFDHIFDIR
ncbi:STAS domain-containing protein [Neptuniibacter sp.]|uniref:STAS domain-containing protein n=1 Tax=Neptuniibacter sp. TaxID=1962643 RepID=UPI002637BCEC|nr:STAS domain-containing protein [Neptuniibacter sp.]MCP4598671.1 STAS domain-containing protein [Neptuniibacter sp.]